jgi:hypothetical protein
MVQKEFDNVQDEEIARIPVPYKIPKKGDLNF